ncbi:TPA: type II secretion system protein [Bacillus paranthracis]|uniref:type II secretion system protein n=1 Tax=Bacillus TaxID=1386 RepID=UPI00027CCB2C|nr:MULTISPECIES: type II secretion system protein [unclassified Bacillus cereus group]AFQ13280.1 hypothetical protein BCK_27358 [Bacillus cereus FRI-35]MDX5839900.1 type II secretion system protein [Bacillus cereus group sp. BfR-BA-01700]MDX5846234.1 type II secretion system protein [Bacillus cereus group sp. BfR-BA-01233]MDX5941852.1 type II secretion system protein [Bacillus cereus group sp. BfR-BA-00415]
MKKGFTLIEILIVVSIISVLVLVFMVSTKGYVAKADLQRQKTNSMVLEEAIRQHKLENESLPFSTKITKEMSNETKKIIEQQLRSKGVTFDSVKDSFYELDRQKIKQYIKGQMSNFERYFSSSAKELEGMVFTYDTLKSKKEGVFSGSYLLLEVEEGGNEVKPPEPPAVVCNTSDPSADETIRTPKTGRGISYDPYIITTVGELQSIKLKPSSYYELGNDIEGCVTKSWNNGLGFEPLPLFTGVLFGKEFTVKNLYINRPNQDFVGLFSQTNRPYSALHIKLKDPEVTGRDYVGAVVGSSGTNDSLQYEFTHVENGKVTGRNYIGGLIGKLGNSASLSYSSFTGQIKGAENVGGLVGSIEFKFNMTTSYFIGSVVGENNVGGVSGKADVNNGYIALNKVYVVADLTGGTNVNYLYGVRNLKVGGWYDIQFSDVYFDKEKTKYITQEKQGEVTGLTTEQMKNPANFSEYWHFGRDWEVDPSRNDGYPIVIVTYE